MFDRVRHAMCSGKHRYADRRKAGQAAQRAAERTGKPHRTYKCPLDGHEHYHITSQPKKDDADENDIAHDRDPGLPDDHRRVSAERALHNTQAGRQHDRARVLCRPTAGGSPGANQVSKQDTPAAPERGADIIQETLRLMREEGLGWSKAMETARRESTEDSEDSEEIADF